MVSTEEPELYEDDYEESTIDAQPGIPSVLSTLPVALVVEQTARILEDIKRKIQLQKEEEERQKLELQNRSESPTYFTLTRPIRAPSSDDGLFSASTTKSFVVLNHRYSDGATLPNNISPLNHTSIPQSLSPDSGTDYEPFSASSSISPPFLSTTKRTNDSTSDVMKLSHNSDDEIFKPLSSFSKFVPTALPPKLTAISPTTSLSSIYSSARRFSGITISQATTASLAKSTPSISTDLIYESHHKPASAPSCDHQRPFSFQVLQSNFKFDTKSFDTYHEALLDPPEGNARCKSLASIPSTNEVSISTWSPSIFSSSSAVVASSQFTSLLNNNHHLTFGDPSAIKPIISALEYPNFRIKSPPGIKFSVNTFEKHTKSFDDSLTRSSALEKYNKFVEQQKLELTQKQQQQADFLSLSLSPPMNRKNKDMPGLKGCTLSL